MSVNVEIRFVLMEQYSSMMSILNLWQGARLEFLDGSRIGYQMTERMLDDIMVMINVGGTSHKMHSFFRTSTNWAHFF